MLTYIFLAGDWSASEYHSRGHRIDHFFRLSPHGTYERRVTDSSRNWTGEDKGTWSHNDVEKRLRFHPQGGEPNSGEAHRLWTLFDVLDPVLPWGDAMPLAVLLRRAGLISRNLPILLYRVYLPEPADGTRANPKE